MTLDSQSQEPLGKTDFDFNFDPNINSSLTSAGLQFGVSINTSIDPAADVSYTGLTLFDASLPNHDISFLELGAKKFQLHSPNFQHQEVHLPQHPQTREKSYNRCNPNSNGISAAYSPRQEVSLNSTTLGLQSAQTLGWSLMTFKYGANDILCDYSSNHFLPRKDEPSFSKTAVLPAYSKSSFNGFHNIKQDSDGLSFPQQLAPLNDQIRLFDGPPETTLTQPRPCIIPSNDIAIDNNSKSIEDISTDESRFANLARLALSKKVIHSNILGFRRFAKRYPRRTLMQGSISHNGLPGQDVDKPSRQGKYVLPPNSHVKDRAKTRIPTVKFAEPGNYLRGMRHVYTTPQKLDFDRLTEKESVIMVSAILQKIVDINDFIRMKYFADWLEHPEDTDYSNTIHLTLKPFTTPKISAVSIIAYMTRLVQHSRARAVVLISLLIYFDRIAERVKEVSEKAPLAERNQHPFIMDSYNIHRLIITGFTISLKYITDLYYKNDYLSALGGVTLKDLNFMELRFLVLLDFKLAVSMEELQNYGDMLLRFSLREIHGEQ